CSATDENEPTGRAESWWNTAATQWAVISTRLCERRACTYRPTSAIAALTAASCACRSSWSGPRIAAALNDCGAENVRSHPTVCLAAFTFFPSTTYWEDRFTRTSC